MASKNTKVSVATTFVVFAIVATFAFVLVSNGSVTKDRIADTDATSSNGHAVKPLLVGVTQQ